MNKYTVVFLGLLFAIKGLSAQVIISKSKVDYSLKSEKDSVVRMLTFGKEKDSSVYTSAKYTLTDFSQTEYQYNLKDEIVNIKILWNIAEDSLNFSLRSFHVGYPLQYADILTNHIQAFIDSKDWRKHVQENGKKLDYRIIKKVMLDYDVYQPLNDFLKSKGYIISGFYTEKHGFVTKENLQKAGFSGNEIIPMPYIVWAKLEIS